MQAVAVPSPEDQRVESSGVESSGQWAVAESWARKRGSRLEGSDASSGVGLLFFNNKQLPDKSPDSMPRRHGGVRRNKDEWNDFKITHCTACLEFGR